MEPPLIGITAGNDPRAPQSYVLRWDYMRSIEQAGGVPLVLAPSGAALHSSLVERLDGLVLTGGMDIDPACYGETPHETVSRVSKERDEFEFLLTLGALRRNLPILGLCRGLQVLNVVLGGSLIQDIPSMVGPDVSHNDPERPRHVVAHEVVVHPGTRLYAILQKEQIEVNSFHHQCVNRPGEGLVLSASAADGVVEGIELPSALFVLGVQWHPEAFWKYGAAFAPLFRAFVKAACSFHHTQ
jgi:putative glutamine amidotransferase